jgi:hypothetical protein
MMNGRNRWFLVGLFLTTVASLLLEVLATRLLSAMTWYHLSFFAVSVAMFGMSAGAVTVYLKGDELRGERAEAALGTWAGWLAIVIPLGHVFLLAVPIPVGVDMRAATGILALTVSLGVPFFVAGVVVAIALTRIPGKIGLVYAVDLAGAALGTLLIIPLLEAGNASSVALFCGALAAAGAFCFRRFAGAGVRSAVLLVVVLSGAAVWNAGAENPLTVWYSKGQLIQHENVTFERWNVHAQLVVRKPSPTRAGGLYWGPGEGADAAAGERDAIRMVLDGDAGTVMPRWDGVDLDDIAWVRYDVTSLPYHIRRGGEVGIIGVGGGRDLLTAVWAESKRVTGIEINGNFKDLLEGELREFCAVASRPEVEIVHDEARSFLTRTEQRFDVLQMSLIDTWAATGAGAFTLTENGLYTIESWRVFLEVLKPRGVFSVSRWYDPGDASETSRLLALGTAALLERGVAEPAQNLVLIARGRVATLLTSVDAYDEADLRELDRTSKEMGFQILVSPRHAVVHEFLTAITRCTSRAELDRAVEHEYLDFSVPTDERPYFFNILKPSAAFSVFQGPEATAGFGVGAVEGTKGVMAGNMVATTTLAILTVITLLLVLIVIGGPLAKTGLPRMKRSDFLAAVAYFATIGLGFMMVQVPFMQRFSVYLGHPTYAVVVTLFSMILMTGVGSFLSDRLDFGLRPRGLWYPVWVVLGLLLVRFGVGPISAATIESGLLTRCLVVVAIVSPVSVALGFCFPLGMRMVTSISEEATPWMWAVNGAFGVLGAVLAVGVSMWSGISTSLDIACVCYVLVLFLARRLNAASAT